MLRPTLTAIAAGLVLAAPAQAADRQVAMDLTIKRFVADEGRVYASATATSRVTTKNGKRRTRVQAVRIRARGGGANCRVLTLQLDDLQLKLLGLNLNTSAINLRISGDRDRALGALFCRLASGIRLSDATRSLNRRIARKPMRVLAVRSTLPGERKFAQQTQPAPAAPQCQVLRLVLGPLDLDLLGLVVELYGRTRNSPVTVDVTATPGGGVLGDLFCQLATTGVTLRPKTN